MRISDWSSDVCSSDLDWDSFKPNFFLLAPPGAVSDLVPRQYLTSFYLPPDQRTLLRELVPQFPNVTVIDIDALLTHVRGIVERIIRAVEFIFGFTLLPGPAVLLAELPRTRTERVTESPWLTSPGARQGILSPG